MATKRVSEQRHILLVDDSPDTLEVLQRNLEPHGYAVLTAGGASEAIPILERGSIDMVITDLKMPGISGFDVIRHVRENYKDIRVLMITGYPSVEGAVTAVKTGADDYLAKPFTEEELLAAVRSAFNQLDARKSIEGEHRGPRPCFPGLLGQSPAMREVFEVMQKATRGTAPVLIRGESGTGKEMVARAIHYHGQRPKASFMPVHCSAIPVEMLESELFGHRESDGSDRMAHVGFIRMVGAGTLFIDEITDTPPAVHVGLVQALQDKQWVPPGASRPVRLEARIIAATNKDLRELVRTGAFREDLFYQLSIIEICLPPLRDRGDDILLLAHHFASAFCREQGRKVPRFTDRALHLLRTHAWPGNVRELANTVKRLIVLGDEDSAIDAPDLPTLMRFSAAKETGVSRTLDEVEREHIEAVLASVDGNQSRAADILGIDRKTLRMKVRRFQEQDAEN